MRNLILSCNICQKSFTQRSNLSSHCKSSAHLKRKEKKNSDSSSHENVFIDCGETIKVEDIKDEINEEESDKIAKLFLKHLYLFFKIYHVRKSTSKFWKYNFVLIFNILITFFN